MYPETQIYPGRTHREQFSQLCDQGEKRQTYLQLDFGTKHIQKLLRRHWQTFFFQSATVTESIRAP